MILGFKIKINKKPTRFVEKIIFGLYKNGIISLCKASELLDTPMSVIQIFEDQKIHTIREDNSNRWKPGVIIDFFINARQKNMFRFAPRIPVVSTQDIEITLMHWARIGIRYENIEGKVFTIKIDGDYLNASMFDSFAQNDGFDTVEEFFKYFNKDFKGKIIHWTDKRY